MELGERVAARLAGLSPKLREAARYVLDHPDEIATRSLRQVARSAGMSAPTFSRVAEALDFEGYDDLRAACLSRLRAQEVSYAAKAQALQETARPGHADGTFIIHQARATIANINHMLDSIDPARIEAAARRLSVARRVILVGMMSSRPFVDYLGYIGSMAFDNWHVLGGTGGGDAALLSDAGPEDVALVISAAPYASGSIQAAAHLCRAGVHVLGITDGLESPLQAHCHSAFTVSTETPQFFTSHAATLVLIETLVGLVVQGGGASVAHRIARVEATNRDLGAYHRSER